MVDFWAVHLTMDVQVATCLQIQFFFLDIACFEHPEPGFAEVFEAPQARCSGEQSFFLHMTCFENPELVLAASTHKIDVQAIYDAMQDEDEDDPLATWWNN